VKIGPRADRQDSRRIKRGYRLDKKEAATTRVVTGPTGPCVLLFNHAYRRATIVDPMVSVAKSSATWGAPNRARAGEGGARAVSRSHC